MSVYSQTHENTQKKANSRANKSMEHETEYMNGKLPNLNRKKQDSKQNGTSPIHKRSPSYNNKYRGNYYSPTAAQQPDFVNGNSPPQHHYRRYGSPGQYDDGYSNSYRLQHHSSPMRRFVLPCFGRGRKQFVYNR